MFFACHRDEVLFADDNLDALLDWIEGVQEPAFAEDVVVWSAGLVVCVRRPSGEIVWLMPEYREPAAVAELVTRREVEAYMARLAG